MIAIRKLAAFTLIEMALVMGAFAIMIGFTAPMWIKDVEADRRTHTLERMGYIYDLLKGTENRGIPGYLSEVGSLPADNQLLDLAVKPVAVAASDHGTTGLPIGWRGPYLKIDEGTPALLETRTFDSWGSEIAFDQSDGQLKSFGPNRTDDAGADDDMLVPTFPSALQGTISVQVIADNSGPVVLSNGQASVNYTTVTDGTEGNTAGTWNGGSQTFDIVANYGWHGIKVSGSGTYAGRSGMMNVYLDGASLMVVLAIRL